MFSNRSYVYNFLLMDYLCVGHVCMDMMQSGFVLGGSAGYCSLYAKNLGYSSGVFTSFGGEYEFKDILEGLDYKKVVLSERSTIFENRYVGEKRKQILHSIAADILLNAHISKEETKILHLCPLADELKLGPEFSSDSFVCMTIQGWLRDRNALREVVYKEMNFEMLRHANVVILSDEDIPDLDNKLDTLRDVSKLLIITNGSKGARCFFDDQEIFVPAFPAKLIDPTGAGDIFATGFCLNFIKSQDIHSSIVAGHCLASLCVEREGVESIPTMQDWKQRIVAYNQLFK